jgi:tetratricopeptide (TPR) repeat protein
MTLVCGLFGLSQLALPSARADSATEARMAFQRGVDASREQRWDDARHEFRRSRELVVKPSTLFNLAVADMKLGLSDEALEALDAFERIASPTEHAAMLERATALRAEAERGKEAARPATERARGLLEPEGLSGEAQASFSAGHDAFARGDDAEALTAFLETYRLSRRDELLFDIGVVADRLRDDERAIDAFDRFVRALPQLPEADLAERRLARLRRLQTEKSAAEPATTITEKGDETRPVRATETHAQPAGLTVPRVLIVLGAVLTGGTIGAAVWLAGRESDWQDCDGDVRGMCINRAKVERQRNAAWATTLVLGVASVSLLTAGGVLLAKRKRRPQLDGVQAQVGPRQVGLGARFVF